MEFKWFKCPAWCGIIIAASALSAVAGETLFNGITLPDPWPPNIKKLTREPMQALYLENPPEVIPIDVGRQLFVDDYLIEYTTLKRRYHRPKYHPGICL